MKSLKSQPPPRDANPLFPFLPDRAAAAISSYIEDVTKNDLFLQKNFPEGNKKTNSISSIFTLLVL